MKREPNYKTPLRAYEQQWTAQTRCERKTALQQRITVKNLKTKKGKLENEFDIVLYNGTSVDIIETKYKVHIKFLDELVTKKLENFRTLFPMYAPTTRYISALRVRHLSMMW